MPDLVKLELLLSAEQLLMLRRILKAATQSPEFSKPLRDTAIAVITEIDDIM